VGITPHTVGLEASGQEGQKRENLGFGSKSRTDFPIPKPGRRLMGTARVGRRDPLFSPHRKQKGPEDQGQHREERVGDQGPGRSPDTRKS